MVDVYGNANATMKGNMSKISVDIVHSIEEQCSRVAGVSHDVVDGYVPIKVNNMKFVDMPPPGSEPVITLLYKEHII